MSLFNADKIYKTREEYRSWIEKSIPRNKDLWFLTLTQRQGIARSDGSWISLTKESADQNASFFIKNLNKRCFGHAYKKYGKCLTVIDSAEGGKGTFKRNHRHMLVEKPNFISDADWKYCVQICWTKSRWGYFEIHLERAESIRAVIKYITKTGGDALCLQNLTL